MTVLLLATVDRSGGTAAVARAFRRAGHQVTVRWTHRVPPARGLPPSPVFDEDFRRLGAGVLRTWIDEGGSWGRAARRWERAIPPSRRWVDFLERTRPDVVTVIGLPRSDGPEAECAKAAAALAIPTVVVDSFLRRHAGSAVQYASAICAANGRRRRELVAAGIAAERIVVTGDPADDLIVERIRASGARRTTVVYLARSPRPVDDIEFAEEWIRRVRGAQIPVSYLDIVIVGTRRSRADWQRAELERFGGVSWVDEGSAVDPMAVAMIVSRHPSAVTSAARAGCPVFLIGASTAEHGEGIHLAKTLDEHLSQLAALVGPPFDLQATERFAGGIALGASVGEAIVAVAGMAGAQPRGSGGGLRRSTRSPVAQIVAMQAGASRRLHRTPWWAVPVPIGIAVMAWLAVPAYAAALAVGAAASQGARVLSRAGRRLSRERYRATKRLRRQVDVVEAWWLLTRRRAVVISRSTHQLWTTMSRRLRRLRREESKRIHRWNKRARGALARRMRKLTAHG